MASPPPIPLLEEDQPPSPPRLMYEVSFEFELSDVDNLRRKLLESRRKLITAEEEERIVLALIQALAYIVDIEVSQVALEFPSDTEFIVTITFDNQPDANAVIFAVKSNTFVTNMELQLESPTWSPRVEVTVDPTITSIMLVPPLSPPSPPPPPGTPPNPPLEDNGSNIRNTGDELGGGALAAVIICSLVGCICLGLIIYMAMLLKRYHRINMVIRTTHEKSPPTSYALSTDKPGSGRIPIEGALAQMPGEEAASIKTDAARADAALKQGSSGSVADILRQTEYAANMGTPQGTLEENGSTLTVTMPGNVTVQSEPIGDRPTGKMPSWKERLRDHKLWV